MSVDNRTLESKGEDVETLLAIEEFIKEHNYAPSIRDLVRILDLTSTSMATRRINLLIDKGWIVKTDMIARSLTVTNTGKQVARAAQE